MPAGLLPLWPPRPPPRPGPPLPPPRPLPPHQGGLAMLQVSLTAKAVRVVASSC